MKQPPASSAAKTRRERHVMGSRNVTDNNELLQGLEKEGVTVSPEEKAVVEVELGKIREFVADVSFADFKNGAWFATLVQNSLATYAAKVDADYFTTKYPDVPRDAVVDARIALAAKYAAVEGGLNASAFTAAVLATIGSHGGASPLTIPAGATSFFVDLSYTAFLQLRTAYDISVLYGVPLDLNDPEDLWKFVRLAFGIKSAELGTNGLSALLPEAVRQTTKRFFSGSRLAAAQSLPLVGKMLLQRNIIKFAIPVVTIPIATGINFQSTKTLGNQARTLLRREAQIIEESRRITAQFSNPETLLQTVWWIINADKSVKELETSLLHRLTQEARAQQTELGNQEFDSFLDNYREQVETDADSLRRALGDVPAEEADSLYRAAVVAAAVDGTISKRESLRLKDLAQRLGVDNSHAVIDEILPRWKAKQKKDEKDKTRSEAKQRKFAKSMRNIQHAGIEDPTDEPELEVKHQPVVSTNPRNASLKPKRLPKAGSTAMSNKMRKLSRKQSLE